MSRCRLHALSVVALALLLASCAERELPVQRIVLISIDTLGASHLGLYGCERDTSPHLDALGARGVVFDDAMSTAPWTLPAHVSLLTGLYPAQAGVRRASDVLPEQVPTLAEALAAAGYRTGGVINVLFLGPHYRVYKGFRTWKPILEDDSTAGSAAEITDLGIDFLEQNAGEPTFLFLHYFDVHSPYQSRPEFESAFLPPEYREDAKADGSTEQLNFANKGLLELSDADVDATRKLYNAGIRQLDAELGRLFQFLEERFGFADTLVIVTADHGEGFREHGKFLHGATQYQEVLRVPLIVRGGPAPEGVRVTAPVSIVDVAPTLLRAAGATAPDPLPGTDLRRYWEAPARAETERVLFAGSAPALRRDTLRVARRGRFKLIADVARDHYELYDLAADPEERHDLAAERPELVAELSGSLDAFWKRYPDEQAEQPPTLDATTAEHLRALGYAE